MRISIILSFVFLLLINAYPQQRETKKKGARKPNIILIVADDLGYGDLGCYGQERIRTPHLDRMASEGMRFTDFYAGTTVCAPSRSALMTGQHTGHTPIRGNKKVQPEGQAPLPASAVTIAEVLKEAGYTTGDFGKWGLGFVGSTGDPNHQGFDTFFGYNCQSQAHNFYPDHLWHNDRRVDYPDNLKQQRIYSAEVIQENALKFIDAHQRDPFFLYLSYTLPHAALQVAPDDIIFEQYKKQFGEEPHPIPVAWDGKGYQPQAYPRAAYAAMVTRLDQYVGEVLTRLGDLGLDRNTLVVFTSDNGPHMEGGHDPAWFNSSGGFRGVKRDLYEGGIRVPMIAWWPGKVKPKSTSDHVGASWDFMPTFAALAETEVTAQIDGRSILPVLLGQKGQRQHAYLYWEFHEQGGRQAVRMGKWKGVRTGIVKDRNSPVALYDLEQDPGETKDVAAQHPDVVGQIEKYIDEAHVESALFPLLTDH